jgi:Mg2+ and Co2+ transporter CorA
MGKLVKEIEKELEKEFGINLHVKKQVPKMGWQFWFFAILVLTVFGYAAYMYMVKGITILPW